ncbi:PaaI family thioesterase [Alkalihalobacillus sp. AL-G]|uniref:PaaI family thioesterase n=1 Tax=Alkalihalobacillus sp. AL-G TaxID=2926399 RepID=UPI00272C7AE0|nr:PaaI family thioesterase [Alkalihalobacillus sp. AL-G]WLD95036.1 PaaI family thioesterase [Alkalihalobacillus sp. AL-G]
MMETKKSLCSDIQKLIEVSTDEEIRVLKQVVTGLLEKRSGEYRTYIMSFLQSKTKYEGGDLVMTIPVHPILNNSVDIVHGGLTATLADTAMGTLVSENLRENQVPVTSEMKINYTAPGIGDHITCRASILHLGTKTAVTEAKIYNDIGTLVAVATGSFFIIERPQK